MLCRDSCGHRRYYSYGIVIKTTPCSVTLQMVGRIVTNESSTPVDSSRNIAPDWATNTDKQRTYRMWRKEKNKLRNGNHESNYEYAEIYDDRKHDRLHEAEYH